MRMGGFSRLTRRRVPPVTHTDALFAGQSHSIPDNLVALLGTSRAWNCSDPERVFGNTSGFAEREIYWNDVRYLRSFRNRFPTGSFTARDPPQTDVISSQRPASPPWVMPHQHPLVWSDRHRLQ